MTRKQLGANGPEITRIGLGTWAIGGAGWKYAWGSQDDNDSVAVIHEAIDLGINWIDTAAVYGFGHSEEVVGRALVGRRDKVVRCHQVRPQGRPRRFGCQRAGRGERPRRAGGQPSTPEDGLDRPVPGPLARSGAEARGGMGGDRPRREGRARSGTPGSPTSPPRR